MTCGNVFLWTQNHNIPIFTSMTLNNITTCETCGKPMKEVHYGMPSEIPTEEDNWVLGGCIITDESPEYMCTTCKQKTD